MSHTPSYIRLRDSGELFARAEKMSAILKKCVLCPRACGVDRTRGELGECKAPAELMISGAFPHFGEEPPLVGLRGSGTIFLTHCALRCVFCQNYDISHQGIGQQVTAQEAADIMLGLQARGVENINFVTPTHYAPQILQALALAAERGLELPIVWNCGGYESLPVLRALEGIVDIYMPDIKFFSAGAAGRYMAAPNYPAVVRKALREMHRQVGPLAMDSRGVARRGLLIRHLVMPGHLEDTQAILCFIAGELTNQSYVNIMDQYHPAHKAVDFPEINRRPSGGEMKNALSMAAWLGLSRGL
ncbi:MAG: radical SAM protein [Nitrospinota bacterium]|nr:radical SAM protein [Nitrospinota bacterium]